MQNWVYIRSEAQLFTVGFYDPDGNFQTDSDWSPDERDAMRARVNYLNGGSPPPDAQRVKDLKDTIDKLEVLTGLFDDATQGDVAKIIRSMNETEFPITEKIMFFNGVYRSLLIFSNN